MGFDRKVNLPPIISARGITKRFGNTVALKGVDFVLHPGEVHALLGENGAGKSTLINILAGELQPDAGEILVNGEPVRFKDPHHASSLGISVVYQELSLCPNLTAAQNISLHRAADSALLSQVDKKRLHSSAQELLHRLGLFNLDVTVPVRSLSLGQRQLIEIAKALTTGLKVLILDEPNSALTHEDSAHLFRVVRELRDQGIAIVYVSHRLEETLRLGSASLNVESRYLCHSLRNCLVRGQGNFLRLGRITRSARSFYTEVPRAPGLSFVPVACSRRLSDWDLGFGA